MTRLSNVLREDYPRKLVWWMECDVCRTTRSSPEWSEKDLPLSRFEAEGWRCQPIESPLDTCPDCLGKEGAA